MKNIAEEGKKEYWRSLESRHGEPLDPAYAPDAEPLAAPDTMTRRTAIGLMGASFAMAGVACRRPVEKIVPYVTAPEDLVPGVPQYFATAMTRGTDVLGVLVESHMGRPTKIEGNELHPSSLGGASAWAQASILDLYDPDRSQKPQHRSGEPREEVEDHGGGGHEASATWEDFSTFWQERVVELDQDGGGRMAFLSPAHCSPSLARMQALARERWPESRSVHWESASDGAILAGLEQVTGQALRPVLHLDRARVILALDADVLQTESGAVANARGFAVGRRANAEGGHQRLYVAESTMTVTGAAADERIPIQSRNIGAFLAAVGQALEASGLAVGLPAELVSDLDTELAAMAQAIAADLFAAGAEALVIAGHGQSASVHAAVLAVNQALGVLGSAVALHAADEALAVENAAELASLVEAMRSGNVDTLVMLGGNPVYDMPADLAFGEALSKVAHAVHLSDRVDETSALAEWHIPAAHWLESWGDVRAADGTLSVVQPLIAPLFDGLSSLEVLAWLTSGEQRSGHDLVRETWKGSLVPEELFETQWRRTLHDGLLIDSASAAIEV